jgi:hypothetical protein
MSTLEDALRYGGFVLAHAAWIASDLEAGELICPIAVVAIGDERRVVPFEADSQREAIDRGKASFNDFKNEADAWALAREGRFFVEGEATPKKDILTVSSWVRHLDEPITLQQMFRPKQQGGFYLFDELRISIHGTVPPDKVHSRLQRVAMEGIGLHPHGAKWSSWLRST